MTEEDAAAFERCIEAGGIALFPTDTVYGVAASPDSSEGVDRLYRLKGRATGQPAAVMFFGLAGALDAVPELGERTRAAVERLLPGPITVIVANPARRFPLACGPAPDRLGLRVPELEPLTAPLAGVGAAVLQSSANRSGSPDARRLDDVDPVIRAGVDLELDGGELAGTPSTVVDLSSYELAGEHRILRAGAVSAHAIAVALAEWGPG
ncbi:MAG: L-threonylcarbamoyladenylate synthase [Thermoleophilaceae bacterium]